MAGYNALKDKIRKIYSNLPHNLQKVADFVVTNFDRIPFLSVKEISEATQLSVASVVRFSQRIGFTGYQEMKIYISEELQSKINGTNDLDKLLDIRTSAIDTITSIASQEVTNINETMKAMEKKNFDKFMKILLKSERVNTAGLGISYLLAQILAYQLSQVAVKSFHFSSIYDTMIEQASYLTPNESFLAFSFPPYSLETIEAAKYAKSKKVKVLAITNKETAPITFFSDAYLIVKTDNMLYTNSFSAVSLIINAITTECAIRNKKKVTDLLNEYNEIISHKNLFVNG